MYLLFLSAFYIFILTLFFSYVCWQDRRFFLLYFRGNAVQASLDSLIDFIKSCILQNFLKFYIKLMFL